MTTSGAMTTTTVRHHPCVFILLRWKSALAVTYYCAGVFRHSASLAPSHALFLFIYFSLPHCRVNEYRRRGVGLYLSGKRERKGTKRKMNALNKTLEICCTKNKKKIDPWSNGFFFSVGCVGIRWSLFALSHFPYRSLLSFFFKRCVSPNPFSYPRVFPDIYNQPTRGHRIADINLRQSPQARRRPSCHGSERGRGQ